MRTTPWVPVAIEDPAPTPTPDQPPAAREATPVLWICGARAVGKSTVGWRVFWRLIGDGVRTLFLDLQQLGFLEPAWRKTRESSKLLRWRVPGN